MERINKGIAEYLMRIRLSRNERASWILIKTNVPHVEQEDDNGESKYEDGIESDDAWG